MSDLLVLSRPALVAPYTSFLLFWQLHRKESPAIPSSAGCNTRSELRHCALSQNPLKGKDARLPITGAIHGGIPERWSEGLMHSNDPTRGPESTQL
jgi:hypothetical protein